MSNALQSVLNKANNGDVVAMEKIAMAYEYGDDALGIPTPKPDDIGCGDDWWCMANGAGSIIGMAKYGNIIAFKFQIQGVALLSQAAGSGCAWAALTLGEMFAGRNDVFSDDDDAKDDDMAIDFLRKGLDIKQCPLQICVDSNMKDSAKRLLDEFES